MIKIILFSLLLLLSGCASQHISSPINDLKFVIPIPKKPPCDYKVGDKCKQFTAAEIAGATTLGHTNDDKTIP